MDHRDKIVLQKIVSEANYIASAISGVSVENFTSDETLKRAVTMALINIGELSNALTEQFKKETSDLKWSLIRKTRDKIAHHYIDIDPRITYVTVSESVPELKIKLEAILSASQEN